MHALKLESRIEGLARDIRLFSGTNETPGEASILTWVEGVDPFDDEHAALGKCHLLAGGVTVSSLHVVHWCQTRLPLAEPHYVLLHQLEVHAFDRVIVNVTPLLPDLCRIQVLGFRVPMGSCLTSTKKPETIRGKCVGDSRMWAEKFTDLVLGLLIERQVVVIDCEWRRRDTEACHWCQKH
jgi:hypothetical protein